MQHRDMKFRPLMFMISKYEKKRFQLRTSLYDKRDDFNFHIINFPFLSSNIPSSPAYGVFISQLIRYARALECLILRAVRLHLSSSDGDSSWTFEIVPQEVLWSIWGSHKNMKSTSPRCYMTFWDMTIYNDTLN